MRVLAIRGKNLASLEGEFKIDFTVEPLKSAGIFAITGSTGSGKSTLLDALCLALFDDTPRTNRATENNIQVADVKDKTINQRDSRNILRRGTSEGYAEVDFISLSGETFRSRWSVRRSRDRVDGSLQSSELRLTNITTNIEVQGRKTEILAKIVELIGLTFYQFTRAVLLAQGDFATFLKATQKEKAELLEKLTGTDIYSRISTSIYEKYKNAEQDLNLLKERIKDIELLSGDELETLCGEKQIITQEIEYLKAEINILTAKIKWITDEELLIGNIRQAEQAFEISQKTIENAKNRYDYIARIDSVQQIRDTFNELKSAQNQLSDSKVNLDKQELERDANGLLLKQVLEKFVICEADQKQYNELIARVEPQIKQARELDIKLSGVKINVVDVKKEYEQAAETKYRIEKSIDITEKSIVTAESNITVLNMWFGENKQYKEIVTRIDLIINLLDDTITANKHMEYNSRIFTDSQLLLDSDIKRLDGLKQEAERLNNLLPAEIAVLRERLMEGAPCPVCGSLYHPFNGVNGESLQEGELNRAKKEIADKIILLTNNIDNRKGENIRLQSMIENYAYQSKEAIIRLSAYLANLPLWQEQLKQGILQNILKEISDKWNENIADFTKINEQIANLQTTLKLGIESVADVNKAFITKEQKYKDIIAELEDLQNSRRGLLKGKSTDDVEKICADKGKLILDNLTKVTDQKNMIIAKSEKYLGIITQISKEIAILTGRCEALKKITDDWITSKNGEFTVEQLSDLLLKDSHWLTTEREILNKLKEIKTSAEATLAERNKTLEKHHQAQIKPLDIQKKEDLQNNLEERNTVYQQRTSRETQIEMLFANHNKGKERIKLFEKELEQKEILAENWKKLSDMFGSADGAKFKVLAQGYTLDALLVYANKHLQELSKRYELQRIPNTLALQVADLDMLGEIRTVHSLSGGESFLISLALALGLSSLSSNRMRVESLFIDEGFGSLDIDTLRVAMDALERLQTQGRKIGVISHVTEMTERITTQIKVVKAVSGKSKIEII